MKYIRRSLEDVIEASAKSFKAVLITGARQTGKLTLLQELFPKRKTITFDDQFLEDQARENPDMFLVLNAPPVTMDEVQRVPELFRYIKMSCDRSEEKGQFLLSGSQPFRLMELASDSLAGRVSVIELAPLSLREIMEDPSTLPFVPILEYVKERGKTAKAPANIWEIIHRGGYPQLQDLDTFRRFMIACAARIGEMLNYSNIAEEIGKDADTVKKWISILEASGIIYILEPYTASVLKRAIRTPKLYFRDTGLAAYLTRWLTPETLANGAMSGAFWETFVISEILKSYSNRGLDYRYFVSYYRGKDRKAGQEDEIDFIIEENGILHPIEIKKNSRVKAEMTSAFQALDAIPDKKRGMGALICMCPQPGMVRDNILQLPAWYI